MVVETEIRKLREMFQQEMAEMRKLLIGRAILSNWVSQDIACAMLNVKSRQLQRIRRHVDSKTGQMTGSIAWRKGTGKQVQYDKRDIEKYLNQITIR